MIEDRAVDKVALCLLVDDVLDTEKLCFGDTIGIGDDIERLCLDEMLFLGDVILEIDRLRARYSADFLVCDRARWGITGASSSIGDFPGVPK